MQKSKQVVSNSSWRFKLGFTLLALAMLSPAATIFIGYSDLATELKIGLSGLFLLGIPEVFTVLAIIVLGKEGFNKIKDAAFKMLRKYGPPKQVGPIRHCIGLMMFILPVLYGWLSVYIPLENIPGYLDHKIVISIILDVSFIVSFFVLGGNFWDKVRSLFIRQAVANNCK